MKSLLLFGLLAGAAAAGGDYRWPRASGPSETLADRFAPPPGAARVAVATGSFGDWLRRLPLLPRGSSVRLFDGKPKVRQDVHAAVVDLDVGSRDLQQCADAVMRLRAEYLYAHGQRVVFHPDPRKPKPLTFAGGDRRAFGKYLTQLFALAGSASLAAEMARVTGPALPGDVLIQGGYPGHAVLVLDAAVSDTGRRYLLLGQSYMPAQQFHVINNLADPARSPWFEEAALDGDGLITPEWKPFKRSDVRRFAGN